MKIYAVEYNPEENEGVYALSVVKNPAMQSQWITLNDQTGIKLATVDEDRKILMGIALIPNKPIYRRDETGEYNIVFSSKTVEQASHDFVRRGNVNNSTLEHEIDLGGEAVSVVESWIVEDDTHDKTRKYGFKEPVGSWAVMMKVHDERTWQMAKKGEIQGFSIDGLFNMREISKQVNMSENKKSLSNVQKLGKFLMSIGDTETKPTKETKLEDVKLESVMTADGMAIMYDGEQLEAGDGIFFENEGERVPVPVGEYPLENGEILVVEEEGIASGMKKVDVEEELAEEWTAEERASIENMIDEIFGLKEMKAQLSEVVKENETLKAQLKEIGEQPAVKEVKAKKEVQPIDTTNFKHKGSKLYMMLKNKN